MTQLIPCPHGSARSPFRHDRRHNYFVCRTAGGFSRLGDREDFTLPVLDTHFQTGYTNLWIMKRYILIEKNGRTRDYRKFMSKLPGKKKKSHGSHKDETDMHRFFIFAEEGSSVYRFSSGSESGRRGAESLEEALEYFKSMEKKFTAYIIAELLDDIYWH